MQKTGFCFSSCFFRCLVLPFWNDSTKLMLIKIGQIRHAVITSFVLNININWIVLWLFSSHDIRTVANLEHDWHKCRPNRDAYYNSKQTIFKITDMDNNSQMLISPDTLALPHDFGFQSLIVVVVAVVVGVNILCVVLFWL